jgi:hypothetical protein
MKKSKKGKFQQQQQAPSPAARLAGISKTGKKIILGGVGVLVIGYFILSKTDPTGQNWASVLSPFIILGGYAAIGIGILFPAKETSPIQQ